MKIGFLGEGTKISTLEDSILRDFNLPIYGIQLIERELTKKYAAEYKKTPFLSTSNMFEVCDGFILGSDSQEAFDLAINAIKIGKPIAVLSYDVFDSKKMRQVQDLLLEVSPPVWINSQVIAKELFDLIEPSQGRPFFVEINCHISQGKEYIDFLGGIDFISRVVRSPLKKVSKICMPTTPKSSDFYTIRLEFLSGSNAILKLNSPLQDRNELKGSYYQPGQAIEFLLKANRLTYKTLKDKKEKQAKKEDNLVASLHSFFGKPTTFPLINSELDTLITATDILDKTGLKNIV